MNNQLGNRMNMFLAVSALLADPTHETVWRGNKPVVFTTLADQILLEIPGLQNQIGAQRATVTGFTEDKLREEKELEDICHEVGNVLGTYFSAINDEAKSRAVSKSISAWRSLRDAELIAQARQLCEKLDAVIAGDAVRALTYGLDAADCLAVKKELDEFVAYVGNPALAVASRKTLTNALRPDFAALTGKLVQMDKLVLRFRGTAPGDSFAQVWKNARNVRDLGMAARTASAEL